MSTLQIITKFKMSNFTADNITNDKEIDAKSYCS